jgi:AhpD family alkylhydroperoxidase
MTERMDYRAAAPDGIKAIGGLYRYVMQSGLPERLVDLVYLRVSQINGCAYCLDQHSRDLLKKGLALEKLVLVAAWRDAGDLFDTHERAALAWAETVTRVAETHVPDADYAAAASVFGAKTLADLTLAISLMNALNRMAISFRQTPEGVKARRE